MSQFYEKNLLALEKVNKPLYERILNLTPNENYEVYQGKEHIDINIYNHKKKKSLYHNPLSELLTQQKEFEEYENYDFLYFYGIGNGLLIKLLLENNTHQRIVVIDPEIELFFIALHFSDFAPDLLRGRVIFLSPEDLNFSLLIQLFNSLNSRFYAKVFSLIPMLKYYENYFSNKLIETNKLMIDALAYVITFSGNDITDSLVGIKHDIANLKETVSSPLFSALCKKKNTNLAVIVATGPSLHKQLPLLKKVQKHVTIISVDASLPILTSYGIKPDIVTSLERVALTSEFFLKTPNDQQEGIIFLCATLQHKKVLNAITNGTKVMVMRPFQHNKFFNIPHHGFIGSGMSSANMAHELAFLMEYKTCVLIGQDLAYSEDGTSHSQGHVLGTDDVKTSEDDTEIPAYGGKGTIRTTKIWKTFKETFEQRIQEFATTMKTINATEGGAHINGSIELSFFDVIEKYADTNINKISIKLDKPSIEQQEKDLLVVKTKLETLITVGKELQSELEETFQFLMQKCKKFENIDKDKALSIVTDAEITTLLDRISNTRKAVSENYIFKDFYYELVQSYLVHYELNLSEIKVRKVNSSQENKLKAIQWILQHRYWAFSLAGAIKNILDIIEEENPF